MPAKKIEAPSAVTPTPWELADASAMQALVDGKATPEQQKRALNWIIYGACGTYDLDYRPDPREHAVVSGKRAVGLEIVKLLKINTGAFRKDKKNSEQG